MKRSRSVALVLVPALASWFTGCGPRTPTHQQLCVDRDNRIAEDQECRDEDGRRFTTGAGYLPFYHWYYMPYRAGGYPVGYYATGGSYARPSEGSSRIATGRVITGGFGSTASGSAGA